MTSSPALTVTLALGRPRFKDAAHAALAGAGQLNAAWQSLLGPAWPDADRLARALETVAGDFAVAATSADGGVLLAIDRFAMQTLCWRHDGGTVRYAPRADAWAGDGLALSRQSLFDYLYFHAIPSPQTIYEGVSRLEPAHLLLHHQGRTQLRRYWQPRFQPTARPDLASLKQRFLDAVEQGVRDELDGSLPACFLSGGTDSSTVAGMVARLAGGVDSFSIGFEAQGYDEMAYARIAAKHFGARHHEHYVTPDELVRHIPAVATHYDQPFGNSSALPAFCCAQVARQQGVTRMLAGDGGDELYGGNARYATQRVFGWYRQVPQPLRSGLLEPLFLRRWAGTLMPTRKVRSYIEQAREPMPARLQQYNLLLRLGPAEVLTPAFLSGIDSAEPLHHQQAVWAANPAADELNTALAYDWRYTLAESDLPKVRETCALAGVGVGFPMLAQALLDLSLELPADYKLKGMKLRWFFKESLRGFLPDEILTKSKHGFGLPFGHWALKHAGLGALATDSLNSLVRRGVVRADFIRPLLEQHLPAYPGYYGEMVWILMMLEQWLRGHEPDYRWQ
ncbi:asparagine synthetase B family protein [Pseudorhodoferax sp.]|uniref:asparagine synthetase B family protein n=1 Tax=Pseudorhodoferax sp. TaxID=1993553 RepID=UPI002DD69949|nr:asparagine synthase C-terminal domain-containing protein [Pseudorhodoferax sp.]